jgi:hypothetical protein
MEKGKWRNHYSVLSPDDHAVLDTAAARHEFIGGKTSGEAEQQAHGDYLKNKAIEVAAHHYLGMRAAIAANNTVASKLHGIAYAAAMKHLGLSATDKPSQEILDKAKDSKTYSFKAHDADEFFEGPKDTTELSEKEKTQQLVDKIKLLKQTANQSQKVS